MKICFFNTTSFFGGGERKHLGYALKYRELGHEVVMVTAVESDLSEKCLEHKITHLQVKLGSFSFLNPGVISKISRWLKEQEVELVLFNGSVDIKAGGVAALKANIRYRVYWRGIAVAPSKSSLNRKAFGRLTHVITNSEETKRLIVESIPSVNKRTHVVYNGVDFDMPSHYEDDIDYLPPRKTKWILGNAARLTLQKQHLVLLDLAEAMVSKGFDFEIWIAGKGELEGLLKKEIEKRGLQEQVKLLGFVFNVKVFMQTIDVLVFPSHWEGFGFSMVEANADGKPVVAYDISSNPEIISDGVNGVLVKEISSEAFVRETINLLNDPERFAAISAQAPEYVRERFDLDRQAKKMLEVIQA